MNKARDLDEFIAQASTCIGAAYDKGYRAARLDASEYERGLKDAEKAIKRVINEPSKGGLYANEIQEIFGTKGIVTVLLTHSVSEIIKKIREYDERKQQEELKKACDNEIHVGDEVYCLDLNYKYVVLNILTNSKIYVLSSRGLTGTFDSDRVRKTGRNYPIMEILEKLNQSNESEGSGDD